MNDSLNKGQSIYGGLSIRNAVREHISGLSFFVSTIYENRYMLSKGDKEYVQ